MAKHTRTAAGGSSTPAVVALSKAGIAHTLHPYEHDPNSELGYGLEAAAAIGVAPPQVFKTLCVHVDGTLTMGVVPVDGKLDLKAIAHAVGGKKATMAAPEDAERATGYVVGGISPIGGKKHLPVVVDSSAREFAQVYVSGGRRGLDIGLSPQDLVAATGGKFAAIAKEGS